MKKILMLLVVAVVALSGAVAFAEDYSSKVVLGVSTFTVTGDDFVWNANPLVISSTVAKTHIKKLTISKTDSWVPAGVTLWSGFSLNKSTANVARIWHVEMGSATANSDVYETEFGGRGLELESDYGLAITKTAAGQGTTVNVSIQYR